MSRFHSFAIIPAAGRSKRMGAAKLLLGYQGQSLIDHVLQSWTPVVDRVVVVIRADDQQLAQRCGDHDVDILKASPPPRDMKASVQLGLMHVESNYAPKPGDCWLLAPADTPRLRNQDIERVLKRYNPMSRELLVASHNGRRGHPLLVPWELQAQIGELGDDQGVRDFVAAQDCVEVECSDSSVLEDIDTPVDYRRLCD